MKHLINIKLKIMDFEFSLDEIISILGFQPDEYWYKDTPINNKTIIVHKQNGIIILPKTNNSVDFEEQLQSIIDIILKNMSKFEEFGNLYYIELSIILKLSINDENSLPWVNISSENLNILSRINANIDFDIYLY